MHQISAAMLADIADTATLHAIQIDLYEQDDGATWACAVSKAGDDEGATWEGSNPLDAWTTALAGLPAFLDRNPASVLAAAA